MLLPYSRKHELEADQIGLMLMADAGYDPAEAPLFWKRFGAMANAAGKPPEFMSTHPSDDRRAADLPSYCRSKCSLFESGHAIGRVKPSVSGCLDGHLPFKKFLSI